MTDFGTRLKRARKLRHMTQKQLADRLGVEQSAISNYETNFRLPASSALMAIAEELSVGVDYLLGGEEGLEAFMKEETSSEFSDFLLETKVSKERIDLTQLQMDFQEDLNNKQFQSASNRLKILEQTEHSILEVYEWVFAPTLKAVGEAWITGTLSIADEHIISDLIDRELVALSMKRQSTHADIKPFSAAFMLPGAEMHDFPLKITAEIFKSAGWKTYYIGRSIPLFSLEYFLQNSTIDVLVLSVTLKEHLTSCESLIKIIKSMKLSHKPLILLGGSGISDEKTALDYLEADVYIDNLNKLKTTLWDGSFVSNLIKR